jgi:tetratricopeptide (TPR) repeat protein
MSDRAPNNSKLSGGTQQRETYFVGRHSELDLLTTAHAEARSGRGGLVLVRGERGVGKTALVASFLERVTTSDTVVLSVNCNEKWGDGVAPFVDALVGYYDGQRVEAAKQAIRTGFVESARESGVFGSILGSLLSARNIRVLLPEIATAVEAQPIALYRACLQAITVIAGGRTLVLRVEDVQWLDAEGHRLLDYLSDRAADRRLLIVATYRTGFYTSPREESSRDVLAGLEDDPKVRWLTLSGLSKEESARVLELRAGSTGSVSSEVADAFHLRTSGNPFYILAVADLLAEERESSHSGDVRAPPSLAEVNAVPKAVERIVLRQLKRVYKEMPDSHPTLDLASVIGEQFELEALRFLLPDQAQSVRARLQEVGSRYQLVDEVVMAFLFSFRHSTIQEVVYSQLGVDAAGLHARVADFLSTQHRERAYEIYYHLRGAGRFAEAAAFLKEVILERARLRMHSSVLELRDQYESLAIRARLPARDLDEVRLAAARAFYSTDRLDAAIHIARELLKPRHDGLPSVAIVARRLLGQCLYHSPARADHFRAVEELTASLRQAEKERAWDLAAESQMAMASALDKVGRVDDAKEAYRDGVRLTQRALSEATGADAVRMELQMADSLRRACMVLDPFPGIEMMRGALATFQKHGIRYEAARCLTNIAAEHFYAGDLDAAQRVGKEALAEFESLDDDLAARPLNNLGLVCLARGEVAQAKIRFESALSKAHDTGDRIFVRINLATVARLGGDLQAAERALVELEPEVKAFGEAFTLDHYYYNRAAICLDAGRAAEAIELLTRAPPHSFRDDSALVRGKRARFLATALASMGRTSAADSSKQEADEALSTTKPQRWYYELNYYPCEIEFWGP